MRGGWKCALKRFILWDYSRGSVPYDIMVALILAFIFLTPRGLFRDQPKAKNVVMLPGHQGANVFWLDPDLLSGYSEQERDSVAESLIRKHSKGTKLTLVQLETILDSEEDIRGFMAFAKP